MAQMPTDSTTVAELEQVDMWAWCNACRLQVLPEHHGCSDSDVRALLIGPSIVDRPPPEPPAAEAYRDTETA